MSLARTKLQNALTSFFNSEIFIALYSAFVAIVSFLDCNALILSVILLVFSFIFFTQKDLKPVFVPLTMSYFSLRFIEGVFSLDWFFYLSAAVFVCSVIYYIAINRPSFRPTKNLNALFFYAASYVVAGSFAANYMADKLYFQQLIMLAMLVPALALLVLLAANSDFTDPEYVFKILFATGTVIAVQCFGVAISADNYFEDIFLKDLFFLNWGIYSGPITVVLFSVPSCFYLAVKHKKFTFPLVLAAFLHIAAGYLTASRAAFLALAPFLVVCFIATLAVLLKGDRKRMWISFSVCVGLVLVAALVFALVNKDIFSRLLDLFSSRGLDLGRSKVWADSIAYFLENPVFGLGLLHHQGTPQGNASYIWMSHNTFLQALASLGIVGFTGIMIHTVCKYKTFFKRNYFSYFGLLIVISTELYGLIDCLMPAPYYVFPLFLLLIGADRVHYENERPLPLRKKYGKTETPL